MIDTSETGMLSILEASRASGLSRDTIRYYEKIGLLPRALRKSNGHRAYGHEDLFKLNLINCLKKTGMPLEDMKPYLNMSSGAQLEGLPELFDRMKNHRERVLSQIQDLQQVLDYIDSKLDEGIQAHHDCTASVK